MNILKKAVLLLPPINAYVEEKRNLYEQNCAVQSQNHALQEQVKILQERNNSLTLSKEGYAKSYYCRALSGLSGYNISINSDMTVSCNCTPASEQTLLGNLHEQSFKEIFHGTRAEYMRSELLAGRLPASTCKTCCELVSAQHFVSDYYRNNYQMPIGGIMVENCILCNYKCIGCGNAAVVSKRKKKVMSIEDVEIIAKEIKKHKIKEISLFKFGEPFVDNDIYAKVRLLKEYNRDLCIRTSTNGMLINNEEKLKAALLLDYICFSIDGVNTEMQSKYQRGADFDSIIENVKKIREARGKAQKPCLIWKYVVFSWNDGEQAIEEAFDKAASYGFDELRFTFGATEHDTERSTRYYNPGFIPSGKEKFRLFDSADGENMEFVL